MASVKMVENPLTLTLTDVEISDILYYINKDAPISNTYDINRREFLINKLKGASCNATGNR